MTWAQKAKVYAKAARVEEMQGMCGAVGDVCEWPKGPCVCHDIADDYEKLLRRKWVIEHAYLADLPEHGSPEGTAARRAILRRLAAACRKKAKATKRKAVRK